MNYRELLSKYIDLIMLCEGTDFINRSGDTDIIGFTEPELAELRTIADSLRGDKK